ncbi:MAG: hypothetical protein ACLPR9_11205 [Acidimicrobiales bacterium]
MMTGIFRTTFILCFDELGESQGDLVIPIAAYELGGQAQGVVLNRPVINGAFAVKALGIRKDGFEVVQRLLDLLKA